MEFMKNLKNQIFTFNYKNQFKKKDSTFINNELEPN